MRIINLEQAVKEIRITYEHAERFRSSVCQPYVFIVGAGVSCPIVPLAGKITDDCTAVAKEMKNDSAVEESKNAMERYGNSLLAAYPQPAHRQMYFRTLIEGKPISRANLRLAHILSSKQISNLVITPNFDDMILRSLVLFETTPIICDHPMTVGRIDVQSNDVQILHVHGTYTFYDCCNLRAEIERRAQANQQTTITMASKLDEIFSRRSALVIGYSGWEEDVIMQALRRRLHAPLPYNLYWFCYSQESINDLPEWLKAHQDVCVVVPQSVYEAEKQSGMSSNDDKVVNENGPALPQAEFMEVKPSLEQTLPAENVLDALIRAFSLPTPTLFENPLRFYTDRLRESFLTQEWVLDSNDPYALEELVERLEKATQWETHQWNDVKPQIDKSIDQIIDAVRRSQYSEAVAGAKLINIAELNNDQLRRLVETLWNVSGALEDMPATEMDALDITLASAEQLLERMNRE